MAKKKKAASIEKYTETALVRYIDRKNKKYYEKKLNTKLSGESGWHVIRMVTKNNGSKVMSIECIDFIQKANKIERMTIKAIREDNPDVQRIGAKLRKNGTYIYKVTGHKYRRF